MTSTEVRNYRTMQHSPKGRRPSVVTRVTSTETSPRSELYRIQSEDARREIETWPSWMQHNLTMWSETTDSVDIATQISSRVVLPGDEHGRGKEQSEQSDSQDR
jgi:hypothetical protein